MDDALVVNFPFAGVSAALWLPPLAACLISAMTSMVGISGAFLLLPFQMSVLGYAAPSVSATNLVFNLVAIPAGVARYLRERRMNWPLLGAISVGTLPGIVIGYYLRVHWLPDAASFKLFVGCVLAYLAWRLLAGVSSRRRASETAAMPPGARVETLPMAGHVLRFRFNEVVYGFSLPGMLLLSLVVGIVGGIYGVGGGAFIAPFCVAVFGLPLHAIAGATLAATFITSVFGVAAYSLLPAPVGVTTAPDWSLGLLFGAGGLVGMYVGARMQKHVSQRALRILLAVVVGSLAAAYLIAPLVQR